MNPIRPLSLLRSSRLARVGACLVGLFLLACASSFLTRDIRLAAGGDPESWAFLPHLVAWTLWLSFMWLVLDLRARFFRSRNPALWMRVSLEVAFCALYALLSVELTNAVLRSLFGTPPIPGDLSLSDFRNMMMVRSSVMYALARVAQAAFTTEMERRRTEASARALLLQRETLERQLSAARLEALQSQLNPHFLFNALHANGAMILSADRQRAHRALVSLSNLLRHSLKQGEQLTTTLEEELELVREYVELERMRFGDRMRFQISASPDALGLSLPALLLLPLVENAVIHGLEPFAGGGTIEVRASREGEQLLLAVLDDGVGWSSSRQGEGSAGGIGLSNTAGRLRALYGSEASLTIEDRSPRGTRVSVRMPGTVETPAAGRAPAAPPADGGAVA